MKKANIILLRKEWQTLLDTKNLPSEDSIKNLIRLLKEMENEYENLNMLERQHRIVLIIELTTAALHFVMRN